MRGQQHAAAAAQCSSKGPAPSGGSTSGHTTITVWQGDTEVEAAGFKALVAEFNRTHPNITVNSQFYGNSDYALQKVLAAIAGGKPPDISYLYGSWAPNIATNPQLVAAQQVHRRRPELQLERLLPRRAQGGHRRQQHHRDPRAGRQPRARLQQDAVQAGGHPAAHGHLDVDGLRERRHQADQPGQEAVRLGLRQRRQRGHRLALLGDAVAGRRLDPQPRRQAGGVRLRRRRQGDDAAAAAHQPPLDLPRQRLGQLPERVQQRPHRHAVDRAVGPRADRPVQGGLRRHHPARRPEPPDDLRARTTG